MAETLTIRTASSTEVAKIASVGPQGPKGDKGDPGDVAGLPLSTQGDILYRGASENQRLPIGTTGQVLKVSGGIPAWASESGAVTSVNGQTGAVSVAVPTASSNIPPAAGIASAGSASNFARGDHRHSSRNFFYEEITGGTQQSPTNISISQNQLPAFLNLNYINGVNHHVRVSLPINPDETVDAVVIINAMQEGAELARLQVQTSGGTGIYPETGYDEIVFGKNYVFRWNGGRWDRDFDMGNDTVAREILRPAYGCTLAGFVNKPSFPTSNGKRGQLAWGYDDGAERLYICVSDNSWRRATISTWS